MDQQQIIGKYRVIERVASGAHGSVDRAFDPRTGGLAAIKVLHPSLSEDDAFIARFKREAELSTAVDHPNVVKIFEVGEDKGHQFIAMEFLPESLRRLIEQGKLSALHSARLSAQIAEGLGAIHGLGVVHRDMKPHNVLITQDGTPKITDFGIARGDQTASLTATGTTLGTPYYMSPEQAVGNPADSRSDVYALGCMMYQMITGQVPFTADNMVAVLKKQVEEQPKPISELARNVPPALVEVVEQAMQKDPELRFDNGAEMATAIRAAIKVMVSRNSLPLSPSGTTSGSSESSRLKPEQDQSKPKQSVRDSSRPPVTKATLKRTASATPPTRIKDDSGEGSKNGVGRAAIILVVVLVLFGLVLVDLLPLPNLLGNRGPSVEVVHWSTGHLTRDGLLPQMAEEFNKRGFRTSDGELIRVEVYDAPSELQAEYLVPRVKFGTRLDLNDITNGYVSKDIKDPTILTPSSAHWLVSANYELGREAVDIKGAKSIVRPVIGIVTYEDMARCLGWPEKELGFEDIIALRNDPDGWASYQCSEASWGQRPLLAFTDPTTSSTGRSLHLSMYSMGSGKDPQDLTIEDVTDESIVEYVENFQSLIDHYLIGTTVLNTKIYQGKKFGHFFIMPEDNLIHLYEGTERAFINGEKVTAPPISEPMVMIYPKEGSMPRNNCACIVDADWVTPQQKEAANVWIDFIRKDEQQRAFMAAGFRPGTDISLTDPASKISRQFGLNPEPPQKVLNPSLIKPEVAAEIDANWIHVKRPGIVNFVVDKSGSMDGTKLTQAKNGLTAALDSMASNNQVGFFAFSDTNGQGVPIAPLAVNKFRVAEAVDQVKASGQTALYDAVLEGIRRVDQVDGEPDAIRAVVVLTDGQANTGITDLSEIVQMTSRSEVFIDSFTGFEGIEYGRDSEGRKVDKKEIVGFDLAFETTHDVQIFFIGVGDDADIQVGRILAGATSAEFQGVAEDDLANVLEEFSKYF